METDKSAADLTLADKIVAARVKRWHTVTTLRNQNVAEHSFVVMLIALEIARRSGKDPDDLGAIHSEIGYLILRWAMWHDLVEIRTGDIPTPMKRRVQELAPGLIESIEEDFSPDFTKVCSSTGEYIKVIVKLADLIEALSFIRDNNTDDHGKRVYAYLRDYFDQFTKTCRHLDYGHIARQIAAEIGAIDGGEK